MKVPKKSCETFNNVFKSPRIFLKPQKLCGKFKKGFLKIPELSFRKSCHSPLTLLRLHNRVTVHARTTTQQQSNKYFEAWVSIKCGKWRDQFIATLSPINWVGSKIPCKKLGAMQIAPNDCLHQEYLSINIGITSDRQQL